MHPTTLTKPVQTLLDRLPDARATGSGWSAKCPAHDDQRASLSIGVGDDGRALVHCHAGCSADAVCDALGLQLADLMPDDGDRQTPSTQRPTGQTYATADAAVAALERRLGQRSALWTYHTADGEPVGVVVRWSRPEGRKDIRPVSLHPDGWRIGAMPEPRPLYGLPALADAERVYIAEGERAADAVRSLGLTATTSAGGASAARQTDWSPLAGRDVVVLPDHDDPGRQYAATVAGILSSLSPPATVRIVDLPGLSDGDDAVEWLAAGGTRDDLTRLADAAPVWTPAAAAGDAPAIPPYSPYPVDALPEPLRGFVAAAAEALGCDPAYVALPLLAALAAAIGTTRTLRIKRGWDAPAILWTAVVGESGTGKTPAYRLALRAVRDRQQRALARHAEAMARYEAAAAEHAVDMAAWRRRRKAGEDVGDPPAEPQAERCVVIDTTVEALAPLLLANPRGLLVARDELAGWIGSFDRYAGGAGSDAQAWLSMHSAESIVVDRRTGVPRTIYVPRAAVSITGGIQPGILARALSPEHRESGLAARLLLAYPPRRPKRWTEADIDPDAEAAVAAVIGRLYELLPQDRPDGSTRPYYLMLTADAKSLWIDYYDGHNIAQTSLSGDLSAAWSKLEESAARLALVLHLARWAAYDPDASPETVDAASMAAGITLARWFAGEARRVYAMLAGGAESDPQTRLVRWITDHGGSATARDVQRGCRWLAEPGAAETAMQALVAAGRGRWVDLPATGRGGRPTRQFALATVPHGDAAGSAADEMEL